MSTPRRPSAFRPEDVEPSAADDVFDREDTPESDLVADGEPADLTRNLPSRRRLVRWGRLLLAGLGGLVAIAAGLAIERLITDAFAEAGWLGWLTLALAGLALLALLALALGEIVALLRLGRISTIRRQADRAVTDDDHDTAVAVCRSLDELYRDRPETARGRAALSGHRAEVIDGRDLIALAEHEILHGFDETARGLVLASSRRVSLVTAISPRASVDVLFVAAENIRLMRRIAELYGGRPGALGFLRLARAALGHLALTGGMAAGESMLQQIVGHGLAARLSARLGEGVVNGMLTARIGLAAISVARPLPFVAERPPRLADIVGELARGLRAASADSGPDDRATGGSH